MKKLIEKMNEFAKRHNFNTEGVNTNNFWELHFFFEDHFTQYREQTGSYPEERKLYRAMLERHENRNRK